MRKLENERTGGPEPAGAARPCPKARPQPRALALFSGWQPSLFGDGQWRRICARFRLTRRQAELARLLCQSRPYQSIGREMGVSINTVRMHVRALHDRLGARDSLGVLRRLLEARELLEQEDKAAGGEGTQGKGLRTQGP
jgi:DNA-binding CsgD family transcriptional regulator